MQDCKDLRLIAHYLDLTKTELTVMDENNQTTLDRVEQKRAGILRPLKNNKQVMHGHQYDCIDVMIITYSNF